MKKRILQRLFLLVSLLLSFEAFSKTGKKIEVKPDKALDLSVVRQVVHSHLQEVQKCYTDLIIEGMATKGKVTATWDIDDKGKVQNLAIKENTSKDPALEGCVTERVVNWTFPEAAVGKTFPVSYPFQFGN
ncbi:MAG: AgmX/PglI C-terminal domain-containing protein [Pseudobdellovibrionaceae bacterium]